MINIDSYNILNLTYFYTTYIYKYYLKPTPLYKLKINIIYIIYHIS